MTAEVLARLEESFIGKGTEKTPVIDDRTLDLFADKVGQVLDAREKKKKTLLVHMKIRLCSSYSLSIRARVAGIGLYDPRRE